MIQDSHATLTGKSLTELLYRILAVYQIYYLANGQQFLTNGLGSRKADLFVTLIREGKEYTKQSKIDFL